MSWWGSIIGGALGFVLGGPLGALLGAALGGNFTATGRGERHQPGFGHGEQQRVQTAFFAATFSVMGNICKADGRVCENEIDLARQVMAQMDLSAQQKAAAMALFNEGKADGFPLDDVLAQLKIEVGYQPNLRRMFLEIQLYAAYADGVMHPAERAHLSRVCQVLGIAAREFEQLAAAIGAEYHHRTSGRAAAAPTISLDDAYAGLNVTAKASDAEVKKAYRRLTSQHHPDKLVSRGMPEEMMKVAARRTHEIRQAYEKIREARGF